MPTEYWHSQSFSIILSSILSMMVLMSVLPSPVGTCPGRLLAHPISLPAAGVRLSGSGAQHVGVSRNRSVATCGAVPCAWGLWLWRTKTGERDHWIMMNYEPSWRWRFLKGLWMLRIARSNFRTQEFQVPRLCSFQHLPGGVSLTPLDVSHQSAVQASKSIVFVGQRFKVV